MGLWAYDTNLWPPDHAIWRARMAPKAARLRVQNAARCSMNLHDVIFEAETEEGRQSKEAAAEEAAIAGTPAAAEEGVPRKYTAVPHTFSWGPEVCDLQVCSLFAAA